MGAARPCGREGGSKGAARPCGWEDGAGAAGLRVPRDQAAGEGEEGGAGPCEQQAPQHKRLRLQDSPPGDTRWAPKKGHACEA